MEDLKDKYTLENCWKATDGLNDDPLLEYVVKTGDELWPMCNGYDEYGKPDLEPSWMPNEFVEYYLKGEIDTSMEANYESHDAVQTTLEAFHLDSEKFWYLCLAIKDVVMGYTENALPNSHTPRSEMTLLVNELMKMEPEFNNKFSKKYSFKGCKNKGEIKVKVKEGGKGYSHPLTIRNKKTLFYIAVAVAKYLKDHPMPEPPMTSDLDSVSGEDFFSNEPITLAEIWKVALFHKYLNCFLQYHFEQLKKDGTQLKKTWKEEVTLSNGKKRKRTVTADVNPMMLVSRMIYILKISDKADYNDKTKNLLKNNLKRVYKNPQPPTHNSRYSI